MSKICLTGTTGGLGSRVLHHLLHTCHVSPADLILSLYSPSKLPEAAKDLNLDIRKGDYQDPESLRAAFAGADKLLLISYPSLHHRLRLDAHKNAIDAAKSVGVKQIFYTSLAFADNSEAAVMQAHIDTSAYLEEVCKDGSMDYTIVKEGIYSESFFLYLGYFDRRKAATARKVIVPSGGGPGVSFVQRDELGEGTARILLSDREDWRNQRLLLSGEGAVTLQQLADMITEILEWEDEPLRVEAVGRERFVKANTEAETGPKSAEYVGLWASTYPAMDKGETAVVDPLLEKLLGRRPKSLRESLEGILGEKKVYNKPGE